MLSKKDILEIASIRHIKPYQQEKHYIQSVILTALSDYPLIFKGGTYLWFFHNLDRYSTDLDFTYDFAMKEIKEISKQEFSNKIMLTLKTKLLELAGVDCTCKITNLWEDIGFSIKVSAVGPLYNGPKSLCYVDIDVSFREKVLLDPTPYTLEHPTYKLPNRIIRGMTIKEIFAEKIRAIITRDSARDMYDLWYLINKKDLHLNTEIIDLINNKLKYYKLEWSFDNFQKRLLEKKPIFSEIESIRFNETNDFYFYYNSIIENINK